MNDNIGKFDVNDLKRQECRADEEGYTRVDLIFALLCLIVSFFTVRALPVSNYPLGVMLSLWGLVAFGILYALRAGHRIALRDFVAVGAIAVFSLGFITASNGFIHVVLYLALIAAYLLLVYDLFALSGHSIRSVMLLSHAIRGLILIPYGNTLALFHALARTKRSGGARRVLLTLAWIGAGLAITVLPTAIITLLLSYDSEFTALLGRMFDFDASGIWETLLDLIFTVPVAMLVFSAAISAKRARDPELLEPIESDNVRVVPEALLYSAATPILAVYVIFFISQWNYYISGFSGKLPEGVIYSEYARSGFFELCAVCAINAVIMLVFTFFMKKNAGRGILGRIYVGTLSVFTLVLIATAISKTLLYIRAYGLTANRVIAAWFMILLALIFVATLVKVICSRFPIASVIAIGGVVLFALLAIPNVDGIVADYNVNAYLSGKHEELDLEELERIGASSVAARVRLEEELVGKTELTDYERELLEQVTESLDKYGEREDAGGFFGFSFPDARARRLLDKRAGK